MKEKNSNGMGSLTYVIRNGKKYWTGRITLGIDDTGKQIRRSFSSFKKSEVIEKMQKAQRDFNISGTINDSNKEIGAAIKYWIFNIKAKEIKSTTIAKYNSILTSKINPYPFSKMKIKDITIIKLQDFISFLADTFSRGVAKDSLSIFKGFFDYCIILGMLTANPASYVKLPKNTEITSPDKYKVFSKDEQKLILDNLDLNFVVDQMLFIDFFTGLRRNELRGLQWANVKENELVINSQLAREYNFSNDGIKTLNKDKLRVLKTESSLRTIPIPEIAKNALRKIKVDCAKKHFRLGKEFNGNCYVFVDDMCSPIEEKRANRRIQRLCKNLGLAPRPLHSIRHSYATRLFENKVDIKTVQQLMGHSDYKTTLSIYTHVMPDVKEKAVSIFDNIYSVGNR